MDRFEKNQSMFKKSLRRVVGAEQVEKPAPPPKFTPISREDIEQNFEALTKKFEIERKCPDKNPLVELERLEREKYELEKLKKAQEPPELKPEIALEHTAQRQQKANGRRIGIRR